MLRGLAGIVAIEPAIRPLSDADFAYEELDEPSLLRASVPAPFDDQRRQALQQQLDALSLSAALPPTQFADVDDRDWADDWKQHFGIRHIGRRLVIVPSWEDYAPQPREVVISLDPGRAFGTGEHETTRLCLAALEQYVRPGDVVVDIGTGSGVLAIAAAKLGAGSVLAIDSDPQAAEVALENVRVNGVERLVTVLDGEFDSSAINPKSADLVVANISSAALIDLTSDAIAVLKWGAHLIGSGFIDETQESVQSAFASSYLRTIVVEADEEWRCIVASSIA